VAIKVKSVADATAKWKSRASVAAPDYEAGIKNPKRDWASETQASKEAYVSGVQGAIGRGAFEKGVAKAGTEKWSSNALSKGKARFTEGVQKGEGAYTAGVGPVLDTIGRISLPTKGSAGAPQNIERVRAIADALHQQKIGK
jgi:hypothetical protein